jgi:hypothetical protein
LARKKKEEQEKREKKYRRAIRTCFTSRAHACGADESANVDIWRAICLPDVAPDGAPEYAGTRRLKAQTFHRKQKWRDTMIVCCLCCGILV